MVESWGGAGGGGREIRLCVDGAECVAGCEARWDEGRVEGVWVYLPFQPRTFPLFPSQVLHPLLILVRGQLDYTAGVLPITYVDRSLDKLSPCESRNGIEASAYKMYDADEMHGLPVGVQVVGRRLEEEKVLAGMRVVEQVVRMERGREGRVFELLKPWERALGGTM